MEMLFLTFDSEQIGGHYTWENCCELKIFRIIESEAVCCIKVFIYNDLKNVFALLARSKRKCL